MLYTMFFVGFLLYKTLLPSTKLINDGKASTADLRPLAGFSVLIIPSFWSLLRMVAAVCLVGIAELKAKSDERNIGLEKRASNARIAYSEWVAFETSIFIFS
jgi:hypothetical protein